MGMNIKLDHLVGQALGHVGGRLLGGHLEGRGLAPDGLPGQDFRHKPPNSHTRIPDSVRHFAHPKGCTKPGIGQSLHTVCSPSTTYYSIIPLIGYLLQYRQSPVLPLACATCFRMALIQGSCSPPGMLLVQSNVTEPKFLIYVFHTSIFAVHLPESSRCLVHTKTFPKLACGSLK